ncbi:MAG TPA: hypothetical protein VIA82_02345 [Candidatus Limnocylindria bacterium]|jgi:hypothetical protein
MTDVGFIIAGYGVILGGTALYVGLLLRRLAAARRVSLQIRHEAESAAPAAPDRQA